MTTSFIFQTFLWNDVVRAAVILVGAVSFARSAIVVTVGFQLTPFPLSASVSCFHSVPPHLGPAGLEPACAATPATSAAAAAARTTFIFPTSMARFEPQP